MVCRRCGFKIYEKVDYCPSCGYPTREKVVYTAPHAGNTEKVPQKKKKRVWLWFVVVFLGIMILGTVVETEEVETPEPVAEVAVTPEPTVEVTEIVEVGDSKETPFVLTADELATEIEADIEKAKEKYNGKWVEITGKISGTSNGGIVYGYYIFGESATTGLRIICWCDDGPYSGSVTGDTRTFLGQLREVTTFNATEIGDCEIIDN